MNATTALPTADDQLENNRQFVAQLEQSTVFREYRSAFQTATGLPLVLRAAGAFQPPLAGSKQINAFCALMAKSNRACAACLELQAQIEREAITEAKTVECFAGLSETAVPVRLGSRVVAYLQTGQVMFRPPTNAKFAAALKQLEQWNAVGDVARLEGAFFQTRVIERAHYDATVRLLSSFATHLSLIGNELLMTSKAPEPAGIARARAYIAAHLADPLSLADVARAANMSSFYFCKVFKATVGINFTDYVARARVEKIKQALLDPNVRVSELAFAGGFQSLSQFNRVFRRVVGESPSDYRERRPRVRDSLAFAA